MHGPKVTGNVGGDAVGRDKRTVQGDQVGRDKTDGRLQGHNITAEQVIIHQSGEAAARAAVAAAGSRFQLPARNPDFEGRKGKIEEIRAALRAGAAQVTALEGMGGIGKTNTAIEAAHDLADDGRFKDGQLFLDLQGFRATGRPLAPVDALRSLLRPFVPPDETLPESEQELAGRFRYVTRGLDMLLFLDNARDEAQVEPLLPGHPGCAVLITSRNRLALQGLKPIELAVMGEEEATRLAFKLANRRDSDRITPAEAAEIARLCGYLPLSIELAANALAKSRGADVPGYLGKLGNRTKPLKALERAKAVLGLSLEALDGETHARWAALGVFEGDFFSRSAAYIWAVEEAEETLEELEQRSLLTCERIGFGEKQVTRYRLHDLLRAVALEELTRDPPQKSEALRRHAEHYFGVLRVADTFYHAGHDNVGYGLALLDAELANILAARRWAAEAMAKDEVAAELTQVFANYGFLRFRLSPDEHLSCLEASLSAAERRSDRIGQAIAAGNLGLIYRARSEFDRAEEMFLKSLAIEEELGRKEGMAADYGNLGMIYYGRGELDRAEEMVLKGLAINEELGRKEGIAVQLGSLGLIYWERGELDRAEEMLLKSLAIDEELGHKEGMGTQFGNLGAFYLERGDSDRAEDMLKKSLAINEELGRKDGMATQFGNLGSLYARRGDVSQAVVSYWKGLTLFREIGARPQMEKMERALRAAGVDPNAGDAAA